MATLTKGKSFTNGELVTPSALHSMVDSGTVTNIVNADIAAGAAIADTKLAPITTTGKVHPDAVQGTAVITTDSRLSDARTPVAHTHDDRYYTEAEMNTLLAGKQASGSYAPATGIAPSAITGTAVITTDSRLSDARTPIDGSVTSAKIADGTIVNADISASAAIADTKIATISTAGKVNNSATTAISLSYDSYVNSNPLDAVSYAGQLQGKIAQHNSSGAALDTYVINTFGITSFSSGVNSGIFNVNAVSKPGSTLVKTYIGGILSNNTNTGVIYSTASDYRLKTMLEPLTNAVARLLQIPVHRFSWLAAPTSPKVDGFLAHEAQAVVPECVTGTKDEIDSEGKPKYQGIDQSKLVPLLVAAVQELAARVAALEAK